MTLAETLANVRYLTNANGQTTDAVLPIQVWSELLVLLKEIAQQGENPEAVQLLQDWLQSKAEAPINTISVVDLERECNQHFEARSDRSLANDSGFGEALQRFRQVEDLAAADIDPDEIFGNIRDASPGREVATA